MVNTNYQLFQYSILTNKNIRKSFFCQHLSKRPIWAERYINPPSRSFSPFLSVYFNHIMLFIHNSSQSNYRSFSKRIFFLFNRNILFIFQYHSFIFYHHFSPSAEYKRGIQTSMFKEFLENLLSHGRTDSKNPLIFRICLPSNFYPSKQIFTIQFATCS